LMGLDASFCIYSLRYRAAYICFRYLGFVKFVASKNFNVSMIIHVDDFGFRHELICMTLCMCSVSVGILIA
jgi:hypothetical protein